MSIKIRPPFILMMLALASSGAAWADEAKTYCKLMGGSLVQLSAEACGMEGGTPVSVAVSPVPAVAPAPVEAPVASNQPPVDAKLAAIQKEIVALLDKPVVNASQLRHKPEGIERTARFGGCKLMVDEDLHIDLGNLLTARKNFRINSVINLDKIDRKEFGLMGEIESNGGKLKAAAVYIEEGKREAGNDISISVSQVNDDGGLEKYRTHGVIAFLNTPIDDLWIQDEYGYPKENEFSAAATDKIRILLIVNSMEDAQKLETALEQAHAMCKPQ